MTNRDTTTAHIRDRRHPMGTTLVMVTAVVAGLLVESVELVNALALPNLFSYDLGDSSLDFVGNFAGLGVGLVALLWAKRRSPSHPKSAQPK